MSNNGIPPLNDWQADNYPVIYDEGADQTYYVKTGTKVAVPSSGGAVLSTSVTLTDAQIKANPSTAIEVVPAPGADKVILFMGGVALWSISGGAYTGVDATSRYFLTYGDWLHEASTVAKPPTNATNRIDILTQGPYVLGQVDWEDYLTSNPTSAGLFIVNEPLKVYMSNGSGDLGGGNAANTLKVTVYYVVVDL